MHNCAIIHPLHLELETAVIKTDQATRLDGHTPTSQWEVVYVFRLSISVRWENGVKVDGRSCSRLGDISLGGDVTWFRWCSLS